MKSNQIQSIPTIREVQDKSISRHQLFGELQAALERVKRDCELTQVECRRQWQIIAEYRRFLNQLPQAQKPNSPGGVFSEDTCRNACAAE